MLKKRLRKTFSSVRLCEFGLEVNAQKFEWLHVFMSRHQNKRHYSIKIVANKLFEYVADFKYFGTTVTDQNCIHEEIKNRMTYGA
jgi:hypothetical protein